MITQFHLADLVPGYCACWLAGGHNRKEPLMLLVTPVLYYDESKYLLWKKEVHTVNTACTGFFN